MEKRINVRVPKDLYDFVEKYKLENNLEDISDALRAILYEKKSLDESFFKRLKNLFFFYFK